MTLMEYFEKTEGMGVLATADAQGRVDAALYACPHFLDPNDESALAFLMADRLSHRNLEANPHAAFLFIEHGEDHAGKRLSLTKIREETDPAKIQSLRRRNLPPQCEIDKTRYLVHFHVDSVRPLVGDEWLAASTAGQGKRQSAADIHAGR